MDFKDTGLPDHRATQLAFERALFQVAVHSFGDSQTQDTGMGPGSLKLLVRAGQVLNETIPSADPEQVAAAVLFLNLAFQEPSGIKRAFGNELPKVCAWAQEWRDVNRGRRLEDASLELRQIVTAVNIALIEGFKNNLPSLNVNELREDLAEKDLMARQIGDIQAPALAAKFRQVRDEIDRLLAQPPRAARPRRLEL
jgi:hypothetical protein